MSRSPAQRTARDGFADRRAGPAAVRAVVLVSLLAPLAARADGAGVLVGENARLHFSLELEGRYDSLAGQGGIGNVANPVVDPADFLEHVRPGLRLLAPGSQVDFEAGANLDWTRYTGWLAPTTDLSYVGANANAALEVGKGGQVGFRMTELFTRSDRTTNPALAVGAITNANALGARLAVRPGGGAIEGGLSYDFGLEAYTPYTPNTNSLGNCSSIDSCNAAKYAAFDSQTHRFGLDGRWRFLPKTAFVLEASWALRFYGSSATNVDTKPLRILGGLSGLITEKVRVVLEGGWEKTFAAKGDEASTAIGRFELSWNPAETAGLTLGAQRSIEPVSDAYAWYDDWRAYVSGKLAVGGRLQLTASARLDRIGFANGVGATPTARTDTQGSLDAAAEVEVFRLLHVVAGTTLTSRDSSEGGLFTYQRTEVWLRLALAY